jgi:hypothetical protein
MIYIRRILLGAAALAGLAVLVIGPALPQSTTFDQVPVPLGTTGQSELLVQSYAVPGGTLYAGVLRPPGATSPPVSLGMSFVPTGTTTPTRPLALTDAKSTGGVPMTAAAGTPSATVAPSRTAGTSLVLVGEATSSSAKTDNAMWEFRLPDSYVAGANIPVVINANYTGGGTITGASTTLTVTAYAEGQNGAETALTVSAAQQFTGTAANYTFTITGLGSGLAPNSRIVVSVAMLVTSSSGANTGQINSIAFGA